METKTTIWIVRHGETEWNLSGRWQGHADAPLSERGEAQARALGERLKEESFDACYVSDLGRALRTAELILGPAGMRFESDERLRELDLGVMQGLTTAEMQERCPEVYDSFRNAGPDYHLPEGESLRQFHHRCVEALEDYAKRHAGGRVLLVTHGGVLGAIFRYVAHIPLEAPRGYVLLNCSVNVVDKRGDSWNLLHWGDVSHLNDLESLDDE
jgi:probable phosphoglycerate mutase